MYYIWYFAKAAFHTFQLFENRGQTSKYVLVSIYFFSQKLAKNEVPTVCGVICAYGQ